MPENYNMFDKMGGNIQKKKLEKALEMLRSEDPNEIRKRLGHIDTNEILEKINEFDPNKLSQMGISLDEIKSKITEKDFEKLIKVLGPDGAVIAQRLKSLLR
ncbi:MAG: membrane trafficking protein [Acetivibrionales bacterium]